MDVTSMWPLIGTLNRTSVVAPYDRCGWPRPGQEMKHPPWLRTIWMAVWFLITLDMLPGIHYPFGCAPSDNLLNLLQYGLHRLFIYRFFLYVLTIQMQGVARHLSPLSR